MQSHVANLWEGGGGGNKFNRLQRYSACWSFSNSTSGAAATNALIPDQAIVPPTPERFRKARKLDMHHPSLHVDSYNEEQSFMTGLLDVLL